MRIEFNAALSNASALCGATVNGTIDIRLPTLTYASLNFCEFAVLATKADLVAAVNMYTTNVADADIKYGPIAGWDLSMITDLRNLFDGKRTFNADISKWDVSKVTSTNVRPTRFNLCGRQWHCC